MIYIYTVYIIVYFLFHSNILYFILTVGLLQTTAFMWINLRETKHLDNVKIL